MARRASHIWDMRDDVGLPSADLIARLSDDSRKELGQQWLASVGVASKITDAGRVVFVVLATGEADRAALTDELQAAEAKATEHVNQARAEAAFRRCAWIPRWWRGLSGGWPRLAQEAANASTTCLPAHPSPTAWSTASASRRGRRRAGRWTRLADGRRPALAQGRRRHPVTAPGSSRRAGLQAALEAGVQRERPALRPDPSLANIAQDVLADSLFRFDDQSRFGQAGGVPVLLSYLAADLAGSCWPSPCEPGYLGSPDSRGRLK